VVGDVGREEKLLPYVKDADAMVIEATYIQEEADLADRFGHITAARAAELANKANVRDLYLTHFSRRYRERDIFEEAQAVFPTVHVARDFDRFQIRRDPD
jgi:ribonuclease Z